MSELQPFQFLETVKRMNTPVGDYLYTLEGIQVRTCFEVTLDTKLFPIEGFEKSRELLNIVDWYKQEITEQFKTKGFTLFLPIYVKIITPHRYPVCAFIEFNSSPKNWYKVTKTYTNAPLEPFTGENA
jgi:hypothetical protein